jgi:hypothetical protein
VSVLEKRKKKKKRGEKLVILIKGLARILLILSKMLEIKLVGDQKSNWWWENVPNVF